jgi:hypothetical protein
MPAIPTSNKPTDEQKAEAAAVAAAEAKKFEDLLDKAVKATKEEFDKFYANAQELEKSKSQAMWNAGERIIALSGPNLERKSVVIKRFTTGVGLNMDESFYHASVQLVMVFGKECFEKAVKHNVTVRVLRALIAVENEALRKKLLDRVISEGLKEDDIRKAAGKVARKGTTKRQAVKLSTMAPVRVFNKGLDRVAQFSQILGAC